MINKKRLQIVGGSLVLIAAVVAGLQWTKKLAERVTQKPIPQGLMSGQTQINFVTYTNGKSTAPILKMGQVDDKVVSKLLATVDIHEYVREEKSFRGNSDSWYLFGANEAIGRFVPGGGQQSLISIEVGGCGGLKFNAVRHTFWWWTGKYASISMPV